MLLSVLHFHACEIEDNSMFCQHSGCGQISIVCYSSQRLVQLHETLLCNANGFQQPSLLVLPQMFGRFLRQI
ncbi:hypothetical protein Fmac_027338 [Flemingia macrophylla]|uniref:Uncharacterized protein n=1 Tax=Flemingia macrophylla TaxID=520843 RepID=A0ABD1LHG7_9FABA